MKVTRLVPEPVPIYNITELTEAEYATVTQALYTSSKQLHEQGCFAAARKIERVWGDIIRGGNS